MTEADLQSGNQVRADFLNRVFDNPELDSISGAKKQLVLELTADVLYSAHTTRRVRTFSAKPLWRLNAAFHALCTCDNLRDLERTMDVGWTVPGFMAHMAASATEVLTEASIDRASLFRYSKAAVVATYGLIDDLSSQVDVSENLLGRGINRFLEVMLQKPLSEQEVLAIRRHCSQDSFAPRNYVSTLAIRSALGRLRLEHSAWIKDKKLGVDVRRFQRLIGAVGGVPVSMRRLARDNAESNAGVHRGIKLHFESLAQDICGEKWVRPSAGDAHK